MTCSPNYHFGLFGSLFFIAVVISSLLFTPLADKLGRRRVCIAGLAIACLAQTIMIFSTSRVFTYVLIFIVGLAMPPRAFVGYIYAMEFMPIDKTKSATALLMGMDGLVPMVATLWFMLVSKEWKTLFVVATILLYLTLILVFTMPESPKFLLAKGKFAEARAVMTRIAQYNRLKELHFTEEEKTHFASGQLTEYPCKWQQEVEESA